VYDYTLKNATEEQRRKGHHVLNRITSYLMSEGFAFLWDGFHNENRMKMIGHVLTLTICMWQHYDF
jgi:hypothetical protein